MNAMCERLVGTLRRESLDTSPRRLQRVRHILGLRFLDHLLANRSAHFSLPLNQGSTPCPAAAGPLRHPSPVEHIANEGKLIGSRTSATTRMGTTYAKR